MTRRYLPGPAAFVAVLYFVVFQARPAAAEMLVSENLGAGAYRASGSYLNELPPLAFDGIFTNTWNAGSWPMQWIEVDLQQHYDLAHFRLIVNQSPPGPTVHQIWVSDTPIGTDLSGAQLAHTFSQFTVLDEVLEVVLATAIPARYAQVRTTSSPSWVAWREIQVFANDPPPAIPEPATASLLGIGALGLLGYGWRYRPSAS